MADDLPPIFKSYDAVCYRRLSLDNGSIWHLGTKHKLNETVSAWTLNLEVAKNLKRGVPPKGWQGAIFAYQTNTKEVILNLNSLFSNAEFNKAISKHREKIKNFERGIGRYGDRQFEVVLEVEELPLDSVYCWGGYVGDEKDFDGILPEGENMESFKKRLVKSSFDFNQPHWLSCSAAIKRVNNALKTRGEKLETVAHSLNTDETINSSSKI